MNKTAIAVFSKIRHGLPAFLGGLLLALLFAAKPAVGGVTIVTPPADKTTGTQGVTFSLQLQLTRTTQPTSTCFLPSTVKTFPVPGLAVNGTLCVIRGIPAEAGTFSVTIDAANGSKTTSITFTITIVPASGPPQTFRVNLPHWAAFGGWVSDWSIVN